MVCPYCSANIEPIELNGKVFCSNCGLTIAGGTSPAPQADIGSVTADKPEESNFSNLTIDKLATPPAPEEIPTISEPQDFNPILQEAAKDLGIEILNDQLANNPAATTAPEFESKIGNLAIPNEADFEGINSTEVETEEASSHIALENPGNEQDTLEASGILLDILGNENTKDNAPVDPVEEPELPAQTETDPKNDIYTVPAEVKVGFRNKKVKKDNAEAEKIQKIEEKIAEAPEPIIDITPAEATQYDPDTIDVHTDTKTDDSSHDQRSKLIKDYFDTTIQSDKSKKDKKSKPKKGKRAGKVIKNFFLTVLVLALISGAVYGLYVYVYPAYTANLTNNTSDGTVESFTAATPSTIPAGYEFVTSSYNEETETYIVNYSLSTDLAKTITYTQAMVSDPEDYVSDYLLSSEATFSKKLQNSTVYTISGTSVVLWSNDHYVFMISTQNYDQEINTLLTMAGSLK